MWHTMYVGGLVLLSAAFARSSNILAIVPSPFYSHQIAHRQLWEKLSTRGHKVTLLTSDPVRDATLTNLTEIDFSYIYERVNKKFDQAVLMGKIKESILEFHIYLRDLTRFVLEVVLNDMSVQKLIKNEKKQNFDVIFMEFLYPGLYAFSEVYKCPIIVTSSLDALPNIYTIMGNPLHPVIFPAISLQAAPPLSFTERLTSVFYNLGWNLYETYIAIPSDDALLRKHFGNNTPSIFELRKRISLVFLNIEPIFYPPRPLVPTIIPIGGGNHIENRKIPLSKDLEHFIEDAVEGVIYFSLGSSLRSEDFNENLKKLILQVFEELPYRVVWKLDLKCVPKRPKNVYLAKWFPQQTILQNPKIRLFITQGGCQSLDEAIYAQVPILGLPFCADQEFNIKRMVNKGIGLSLDYTKLTKDSFKTTILELINNPKYRKRVQELGNLVRDQPMSGLERAIWWTEYVIRHRGANELKSSITDVPFYEYYHLDIILFCVIVTFILVFIVLKAFHFSLSFVIRKRSIKPKVE